MRKHLQNGPPRQPGISTVARLLYIMTVAGYQASYFCCLASAGCWLFARSSTCPGQAWAEKSMIIHDNAQSANAVQCIAAERCILQHPRWGGAFIERFKYDYGLGLVQAPRNDSSTCGMNILSGCLLETPLYHSPFACRL